MAHVDDVSDAGGGDDDVGLGSEILEGARFEACVARLEKPCRIPFGDADRATEGACGFSDAVTDETEAHDDDAFAMETQPRALGERLPRAQTDEIAVVQPLLDWQVIPVENRKAELMSLGNELVESRNAGSGCFEARSNRRRVLPLDNRAR